MTAERAPLERDWSQKIDAAMTESLPSFTPDQRAAHELLSELRTRIATQPLPYQHGVEARALESLWEIFALARKAMKDNPGCGVFARAAATMLNVHLRPVTAKWHRAHRTGVLDSKDGANAFRADLAEVRERLLEFSLYLQELAYGTREPDCETPPAMGEEELAGCFHPVRFGIRHHDGVAIENDDLINWAEASEISARRDRLPPQDRALESHDAVGLALSGGGIRSATFCLGVVQVLAERGLMPDIDYLSTVSGGGYTGSFITSVIGSGGTFDDVGRPRGPDTARVRRLRRNAKYLSTTTPGHRWRMVTGTLAGLLLNWTAPLFVLASLAFLRVTVGQVVPTDLWAQLDTALGLGTAAAVLLYGIALRLRATERVGAQLLASWTALGLGAVAALLIESGYGLFLQLSHGGWASPSFAALTIVAGPILVRFLPVAHRPAVQQQMLKVMLWSAGLVVPLLAIAVYYALRALGDVGLDPAASVWSPLRHLTGLQVLLAIAVGSGAFALLVLNVNLTGPHKLYRDGLARTFVQIDEAETDLALSCINAEGVAPYHLLNATLNLPSGRSGSLRDRRADFFLFSKRWCGAPSIGYRETEAWSVNGSGLDLATAMAVSGAAVSPQMGLGSVPSFSALLTLLNIRLGLWVSRPGVARWRVPGFACLLREMTGSRMSEAGTWLNLSDGGHIENMGLYELLRRRCKFIICVDGEADPKSTFAGHLTLVRHAQIDFGIVIEPRFDEIRPDERSKVSRTHAQLFKIIYNDADSGAEVGLMLYLKLSLTGDEPELLKRYRATYPEFPHQSTLDQFYDEEQFEAYRQLGVHVADGVFAPALLTSDPKPHTVSRWFRQLAANMLEPDGAPIDKPATSGSSTSR